MVKTIGNFIENDPWKRIDFPSHEKALKKCEEVLVILEEDFENFKKEAEMRRDSEINDTARAIKDMSKRVNEITAESSQKFSDIYRIVSDLRKNSQTIESVSEDYAKLLDNFKSQIYQIVQNKVNESMGGNDTLKKKMDLIIEETEELWRFNQKFIDEHAIDQERVISSDDVSISRKMEALEWFARYSEFLTPDHAYNGILAFKNMYLRGAQKETYINYEHGNESVVHVLDMVEKTFLQCKNFTDAKSMKKLETRLGKFKFTHFLTFNSNSVEHS